MVSEQATVSSYEDGDVLIVVDKASTHQAVVWRDGTAEILLFAPGCGGHEREGEATFIGDLDAEVERLWELREIARARYGHRWPVRRTVD